MGLDGLTVTGSPVPITYNAVHTKE